MDVIPLPVNKNQARKRSAQPHTWKANTAKKVRYSSKSLPRIPRCEHKSKVFECKKVTGTILRKFHAAFYKIPVKSTQDAIILKCCQAIPIHRERPRNMRLDPTTGVQSASRATKQFTIKYNVKVDKKSIPVCQKMFLAALCLKKGRVSNLVQKSFVSGEFPVEKRGGDRKSNLFKDIKASIHAFIRKFKCSEPHYCRSQNSTRKYLASDLNIRKLYSLYTSECSTPAKESYFRHVFNTEFNLGFGSPNTDMCSTCIQLLEKIKKEKDERKKEQYRVEKRIHSLRSKAFYSLLKTEEDGMKILSYDCQKNMNLPKLPDQSCYYSRQFYFYNFTIVEGSSKAPLNKNNVFANVWTENTFSKNSNTIASAVYNHLNKTDLTNITMIRLISDGCGGQNKNSTIITMCCKWLLEHPSIEKIELVFPVTGHSYLPADRVFGNSEKIFRKMDTILTPNQYTDIISQQATVVIVGEDFAVYDFKKEAETILKPPGQWKVQFSQCKRFYLKRSKRIGNVVVQSERFYKNQSGKYENVCRKNKIMSMIAPDEIRPNIPVKALKVRDVKNLLSKHFGEDWKNLEELSFYSNVINNAEILPVNENENEELECERREEPSLLMV